LDPDKIEHHDDSHTECIPMCRVVHGCIYPPIIPVFILESAS